MEELLQLLEKINSYVSDKNYLLNQIHNEGILENDHRKSFQKAKDDKVFSDNELRTIITYFKIANFIEKFQKKIEAYVKSAKLEISRVSNSNSKERLIIEVLNKSTISLNHIKTKFEDELAPIEITEEDLSILFEFSLINPKEIKIDLVDFHMNRVKNSSIILTNDFLKKILEIINKYDLINRLYLVFIYITENTLYKQLDEFILKYSSDLSNISVYDKKKANVLEIINKVKTNNSNLLILMNSYPKEYIALIEYLKSDKDLNGKDKQIQIEEKTLANYNWINFEKKANLKRIHSIFVFCSIKGWLSTTWENIKPNDREAIFKNTFNTVTSRQNLDKLKIKEIEKQIIDVKKHGSDFNKNLEYLSFFESFIKQYLEK